MFSDTESVLKPVKSLGWKRKDYGTERAAGKLRVTTGSHWDSAPVTANQPRVYHYVGHSSIKAKPNHWATWESHLKCWSLINILWAVRLVMPTAAVWVLALMLRDGRLRVFGPPPGRQQESQTWIHQAEPQQDGSPRQGARKVFISDSSKGRMAGKDDFLRVLTAVDPPTHTHTHSDVMAIYHFCHIYVYVCVYVCIYVCVCVYMS